MQFLVIACASRAAPNHRQCQLLAVPTEHSVSPVRAVASASSESLPVPPPRPSRCQLRVVACAPVRVVASDSSESLPLPPSESLPVPAPSHRLCPLHSLPVPAGHLLDIRRQANRAGVVQPMTVTHCQCQPCSSRSSWPVPAVQLLVIIASVIRAAPSRSLCPSLRV